MKLKLELHYKYNIILALANKEIPISKIKKNILYGIEKYNSYSLKSDNKKKISHYEIDENNDLLSITLESEKSLPIPVRGLRYFTQVIMDNVGEELRDEIVRKKSFFRVVDVKEITNLELEQSNEKEEIQNSICLSDNEKAQETAKKENNFTILTNDLSGNKELRKKLMTMIKFGLNCLEDLDNDRISQKNRDLINKFDDLKGGDDK